MNAQHPMAPAHECGLEAALQQMSKYFERARSQASERAAQSVAPRPSYRRNVFAGDVELSLVK
ncbi:hypothetical protein FHR56_001330 [Xanthomonas sacchari]|uniref:hypothetical protein n=1 Tax=unclassified Xanthomonas TaxID=2643310 RepID=UPI0013716060|nr:MULTISPECIES: hypothetical protein [unclassified Xanthomonas]MBB6366217.1 hypothetical protein [Xanthomonas sp. F10]MXV34909.1 hypothetical protein [Xanthomonas sp. LMG 8989]